jgi:hypothetical protein
LYFEDVNLERQGYSCGIGQPFVSAAKFYATIPALPYLLTAQPPYEPIYTLGEAPPGSPIPYMHERPPISPRGGAVQALVIGGLFLAIP